MSPKSKQEYFEAIHKRYKEASRKEKTIIIDECCATSADTVAHCGDALQGMFAYTIDFVDIATGWTEQRAVWGIVASHHW